MRATRVYEAFLMWLYRKLSPEDIESLRPGYCECEHARCSHVGGKGECKGQWPPDEEAKEWTDCACQIFIRDDDDSDGDEPVVPTPEEMEKMFNR